MDGFEFELVNEIIVTEWIFIILKMIKDKLENILCFSTAGFTLF